MRKLIIFGLLFVFMAYLVSASWMTSVTLDTPATSSYTTTTSNEFNFTALGNQSTFTCSLYTNDTGTYTREAGSIVTATNNTLKSLTLDMTEGVIVWNVACYAQGDITEIMTNDTNNTLFVDYTNPIATVNSPLTYSTSASTDINITVIDTFASDCQLWVNDTANDTQSSVINGAQFNLTFTTSSDGVYSYKVWCNDSAGNYVNTSARTLIVDTAFPGVLTAHNYSNSASCTKWTFNFTTDEEANYTFRWGTTSGTYTANENSTTKATTMYPSLTFNDNYETVYYANISVCDEAGNCNSSYNEMTVTSPAKLCTGWSIYSLRETINLSVLYTQTGADYVYWWNSSTQSWLYHAAAATTYGTTSLSNDDVVQIYSDADTTWFRENSGTHTDIPINITVGHNYLPIHFATSFGNLSTDIFKNLSSGNSTPLGAEFRINYFSSYNNSAKTWVNSIYEWSWNNDTPLGYGPKNYLDALWVYSDYNISIYLNKTGYVFANWT